MKNVMISNGLRGKPDPLGYVKACRETAKEYYAVVRGEEVNLIDTFFSDFDGSRLQFLGKSISEGIASADEVVFMDDWEKYDGCRCEHFIATQYGVPCVYLETTYDMP